MQNKKAFSFVEIIIAISIIILLAVIWISSKQWYDENINNTMVLSNIETINNALESFAQENSILPMPGWNTNFFTQDTSYSHSYEDPATFWVYGSITEDTIPKKYLDTIPLDPRTNSYYAYGKTKATKWYELASVQIIDSIATARVAWNYAAETWPYNLIREYNGPNFVYNGSKTNLPYNPEELVLIATDQNWVIYRQWDTITVASWSTLEIFFSDWSVSVIWDTEKETNLTLTELSFPKGDNLNTLVKLSLWAGTIWTKATHLNDNSGFEVYTQDSTAAVRWTIFWISTDWNNYTDTKVIQWIVEVTKITDNNSIETLRDGQEIRIYSWTGEQYPDTNMSLPEFSKNTEQRDNETVNAVQSANEATTNNLWEEWDIVFYDWFDNSLTTNVAGNNQITKTHSWFTVSNWMLNASWTGGYLKYENLNLDWGFAIEMSVRGEALNRNWNYTLFKLSDNNNKLELQNDDNIFFWDSYWLKYNNQITTTGFDKVTLINDNWSISLKINWNEVTWTWNPPNILLITDILIWANYIFWAYSNQWNDIIDYVKIYNK